MYAEAERGVMRSDGTCACCNFVQQATAVQQVVGRGVCICTAASVAVKRSGPNQNTAKPGCALWVSVILCIGL